MHGWYAYESHICNIFGISLEKPSGDGMFVSPHPKGWASSVKDFMQALNMIDNGNHTALTKLGKCVLYDLCALCNQQQAGTVLQMSKTLFLFSFYMPDQKNWQNNNPDCLANDLQLFERKSKASITVGSHSDALDKVIAQIQVNSLAKSNSAYLFKQEYKGCTLISM